MMDTGFGDIMNKAARHILVFFLGGVAMYSLCLWNLNRSKFLSHMVGVHLALVDGAKYISKVV